MEAWREELYHYGVQGMKWGVRRYQNEDGTLTEKGKKHYSKDSDRYSKLQRTTTKKYDKLTRSQQKFQKRSKRPTITDTDLELKRRAGVELSKRYRSYIKTGERFVKQYNRMIENYGINNLSSYQVTKGRELTEQLLRNKGTI